LSKKSLANSTRVASGRACELVSLRACEGEEKNEEKNECGTQDRGSTYDRGFNVMYFHSYFLMNSLSLIKDFVTSDLVS